MHELCIAYNLVEIAERAAQQASVDRVIAVHLRLGAMSGVVKDALLFGYDVAVRGTRLEGSRLEIEQVPVMVYCENCDAEVNLSNIQRFQCPRCGKPTADIRQGKELELTYLEIDDEAAYSGDPAGYSGKE